MRVDGTTVCTYKLTTSRNMVCDFGEGTHQGGRNEEIKKGTMQFPGGCSRPLTEGAVPMPKLDQQMVDGMK